MYACQVLRYDESMATADSASPARSRNVRGEGDKLREQLVAVTVALLDAEGDAARVSVRAIAKAAGVSPTALYLHFPDRDALVSAAVDRGFAAFNEAILAASTAESEPTERIRAAGRAYLDFAERQPELYAVIFSTRRAKDGCQDDLPPVDRSEGLDALTVTVAEARPEADEREARELALTLWASLHGYATLHARPPGMDWPDGTAYVDRLMRAHLGA